MENAKATYLLIVRPNVTWTSAMRVFLTHLNTETKKESKVMNVQMQVLLMSQVRSGPDMCSH